MKSVVVLCLIGLVCLSIADTQPSERGWRYVMGKRYEECPVGTHAYSTGCGQKMPEATCEQPNPVLEEHIMCDYSACYCDAPTVRDKSANKCVAIEDCPKSE